MAGRERIASSAARAASWPKRVFFGAAGAAVAVAPLLTATCPGTCASCYRCGTGAAVVLALALVGNLGRRIGSGD